MTELERYKQTLLDVEWILTTSFFRSDQDKVKVAILTLIELKKGIENDKDSKRVD